jgi:hypothetical protein
MIPLPSAVRVWIATGHTDMRRGMNSLALLVQEAFKRDPHAGDLYVFRGIIAANGVVPTPRASTPRDYLHPLWRLPESARLRGQAPSHSRSR